MTIALRLLFSTVLAIGVISVGCSAGETVGTGSSTGTANTTGQAGTGITITGLAGTTGAANVTGSAGTTATGRGGTNTGNVTGTAGTTVTGAAGTNARGGTTGTGNIAGTTPTTGAAGTTATTGSAGTSGSTTCGAAFEVAADGFARAPAAGGKCWSGYAFAGGDTGSMIMPTSFMACGMPCMLRMMGTVGPAVAPSYAGVGFVGFNLGQTVGAAGAPPPVTPTGTGLTVTFTASTGGLPLRLQLGADTTGSVFWCYTVTAPASGSVTVPYAMFNRTCWDNAGAAYNKEPIVSFQMVVPGGAAATTGVSVAITSVKEN
jgi:hypothetical protein